MQKKVGMLLGLFLSTPVVAIDSYGEDVWGQRQNVWDQGAEQQEGVSREELLSYLQKKRQRAEKRIALIDEEIECVSNTVEGGSFWRCYERAQQQRQLLKQSYQNHNPYQRRRHQRGGMMPNFDRMGMGGMRMPW